MPGSTPMVTRAALRDHRGIATPSVTPGSGPTGPASPRRRRAPGGLVRRSADRVLGGVCGGIGRWLGVDPVVVRIVFVVLGVSGGLGVVAYGALWLALPDDQGVRGIATVRATSPADRSQRALAVLLLTVGALLLIREMGFWVGDRLVWPAVLTAVGLALAWPETAGSKTTGRVGEKLLGSRASLVRVGAGLAAVAGGAVAFAVANTDFQAFGDALLAVGLTVAGLMLIFGPWWFRLGRDLLDERRGRIRSEERAEVAARIHDSVLQTLALIQQRAAESPEIAQLARRQERDLRRWLFGAPGSPDGTLKAAVAEAAAAVEDHYGVVVDVVTVGDAPMDERTEALVAAAREAAVNAAKFAGVATVSVYVEVEQHSVTAFVRDRGAGFDPAQVPPDRQGIAESIRGRMERHGGRAEVRSVPGGGTEVEVAVPRARTGEPAT